MSVLIPDGTALVSPQSLAEYTSGSKTGTKHQAIVICDSAGNERTTFPVIGAPLATTNGTITTATSAVTSGDVAQYNNVTVVISGTYAGVNAIFEASPDAGTTWVPIVGSRLDGTGTENVTGVLAANTTRGWEFTLPAVNRFRVRATAFTSGSAAVIIAAGTMPLEPVVNAIASKPPGAVPTQFTFSGAAVTTEAVATLTPYRTFTAGTTGTSQVITAGKTFRLQAFAVSYRLGAAAVGGGTASLRFNNGGAAIVSSPILASTGAAVNVAISGASDSNVVTFADGVDIPSGVQLAISQIGHATTATFTASAIGYEF